MTGGAELRKPTFNHSPTTRLPASRCRSKNSAPGWFVCKEGDATTAGGGCCCCCVCLAPPARVISVSWCIRVLCGSFRFRLRSRFDRCLQPLFLSFVKGNLVQTFIKACFGSLLNRRMRNLFYVWTVLLGHPKFFGSVIDGLIELVPEHLA